MDITIIDSGINPWHSHVQGVQGGIALQLTESGQVMAGEDFRDELGHGTAIAGVIREKAPHARLHAVKIFHRKLAAPIALLLGALEWAVQQPSKIIHLSLGTELEEYRPELARLCRLAHESNRIIVAAARSPDDLVYPGSFETVIGVCWNREGGQNSLIFHPDKAVEFGAYGRPKPIEGLPQEQNFGGSSFAAARVTAMAAQLLEQNPAAGVGWVKDMLKKKAQGDI
jgi:hypothetical protein